MKYKFLFLIFIFILALFTRLYQIDNTPIYPDEITWMVRAKETYLALRGGNFEYFKTAWWEKSGDTEAISLPLTAISGPWIIYFGKGQGIFSFELFSEYVAARLPLAFLSSAFFLVYWYFIKRASSLAIAVASTLLFIADPVFNANSRLVMNDALLTIFMFLSVVSYFYIKKVKVSAALAAFFGALAFLTKPHGLLVVIPWLTYLMLKRKKDLFTKTITSILLLILFITLLWPSAWQQPIFAIPEYLIRQFGLTNNGIRNFFLGRVSFNPPPYYYIIQMLMRLPVIIIMFCTAGIYLILKNSKNYLKNPKTVSIIVFIIAFLVIVSFTPKKLGVRYILPLWPWIYFLAGYVFVKIWEATSTIKIRVVLICFLAISSTYTLVQLHPNYDLYYNEIISNTSTSQKLDLAGLCYGAKEAAEYIDKCYPAISSFAYIGCSSPVTSYYTTKPVNDNWHTEKVVVIENSYQMLLPDAPAVTHFNNQSPHLLTQNGLVLARAYSSAESFCRN